MVFINYRWFFYWYFWKISYIYLWTRSIYICPYQRPN